MLCLLDRWHVREGDTCTHARGEEDPNGQVDIVRLVLVLLHEDTAYVEDDSHEDHSGTVRVAEE